MTTREGRIFTHRSFDFARALVGLLITMLAGCGPLIIRSDPTTFNVPAEAATLLTGSGPIALSNGYETETRVTIYSGPRNWEADLRQYTETAIALLSKEVTQRGIAIVPQAAKTIVLRVVDVQASPGWVIRCSLTLEAQYADGTKSTVRAENTSPLNVWRVMKVPRVPGKPVKGRTCWCWRG